MSDPLSQLANVLAGTLSPTNSIRDQAVAALNQAALQHGYVSTLFQLAVNSDVDAHIRQSASVNLKNAIIKHWSGNKEPYIAEDEKGLVRDNIFAAITYSTPLIRLPFEDILKEVIMTDFAEGRFPQFMDQVGVYITNADSKIVFGGVVCLKVLAEYYEMKNNDNRGPFHYVVEQTFPHLFRIFSEIKDIQAEWSLHMQSAIAKIYHSSFQLVNPEYMQEPSRVDEWFQLFGGVLNTPVPAEHSPKWSTPRAIKDSNVWWSLRDTITAIFARYMSRFGNPNVTSRDYKAFAAFYANTYAAPVLGGLLAFLAREWSAGYVSNDSLLSLFSYFQDCVGMASTWAVLKTSVEGLVTSVAFTLLCFSEEDNHLFNNDPVEYVRKTFNLFEDFSNPASSAMSFLMELARVRGGATLHMIVSFARNKLVAWRSNTHVEAAGYEIYGAFYMLAAIQPKLVTHKDYKNNLEAMLGEYVLPLFDSQFGFLRCLACYTCQKFADIRWSNPANFMKVFESVMNRFADSSLPVKVMAAKSVQALLLVIPNEQCKEAIASQLEPILNGFFALMNEVENDELVAALEGVIAVFEGSIEPHCVAVCTFLCNTFFKLLQMEEQDNDEAGLAAANCMRAICTLVESVQEVQRVLPALEVECLPVIRHLCTEAGIDFFEDACDLVTSFTYYQDHISPVMWEIYPLLMQAFETWAADYLSPMLPALNNYIASDMETFLTASNGEHVARAYNVVYAVLSNARYGEDVAVNACRFAHIIIHSCRGRIDAIVQDFLLLAIRRLFLGDPAQPVTKALNINLLDIMMAALWYSPTAAFGYLLSQNALDTFLSAFTQLEPHLERMHDKKLSIIGLSSILAVPITMVAPEHHPKFVQVLQAVVDLSVKLGLQIAAAAEAEANANSDEDEVDWDNDEGLADDLDAVTTGDAKYLAMLEDHANKYNRMMNDGVYETFNDDEVYSTPIDDVDEFIYLEDVIEHMMKEAREALFGQMCAMDNQFQMKWTAIVERAANNRRLMEEAAAIEERGEAAVSHGWTGQGL